MCGRGKLQQVPEPAPALPCHQERLPGADSEIDGSKGSSHHDRACHHDACGYLLFDDEPCADAEDCRLQDHPQHPRHRTEGTGYVGRTTVRLEVQMICGEPALLQAPLKAKRPHGFRIAAGGFHQGVAVGAVSRRVSGRLH
jgi:hypothetical protein